ncbi:hypothetical protein BU16DRAFT_603032 [Lophium mytilinum]|uniref:Methyltransferase domain-containing protein n=1 Tax=Lophium mytilinum TaxID=390894 RepID=A0A6A6R2V4_9PEZI|nr:hypothetical protein BU16DRAFT_603032 [Lophium mytilinum]
MSSNSLINLPADSAARSTSVPWYAEQLEPNQLAEVKLFFIQYSDIRPDEVEAHILRARDAAWSISPWPCIGEFWFLTFSLSRHPAYTHILDTLRFQSHNDPNPPYKLLDLGTCLGQDLRKLAYDGAPIPALLGADLLDFEAAGHALFRDLDRFTRGHYIQGNIFAADDDAEDKLLKTRGSWFFVHVSMFLHIWPLEQQEEAAANILKLLKKEPGAMVIGTQTGTLTAKNDKLEPPFCRQGEEKYVYRHNCESMAALWHRVADAEGVKVDVWAGWNAEHHQKMEKIRREVPYEELSDAHREQLDERKVVFSVTRV